MAALKMKRRHTPPTEQQISSFEHAFEVKLPDSFLEFIRHNNGAVPVGGATFPMGSNERVVERFLPILESPSEAGTDGWYDIAVVTTAIEDRLLTEEDDDRVGYNVFPIAALFAGDFVCLDYRSSGTSGEPSVVVWNHEESDDSAPVFDAVAPSFAAFLGMLAQPWPEG